MDSPHNQLPDHAGTYSPNFFLRKDAVMIFEYVLVSISVIKSVDNTEFGSLYPLRFWPKKLYHTIGTHQELPNDTWESPNWLFPA